MDDFWRGRREALGEGQGVRACGEACVSAQQFADVSCAFPGGVVTIASPRSYPRNPQIKQMLAVCESTTIDAHPTLKHIVYITYADFLSPNGRFTRFAGPRRSLRTWGLGASSGRASRPRPASSTTWRGSRATSAGPPLLHRQRVSVRYLSADSAPSLPPHNHFGTENPRMMTNFWVILVIS